MNALNVIKAIVTISDMYLYILHAEIFHTDFSDIKYTCQSEDVSTYKEHERLWTHSKTLLPLVVRLLAIFQKQDA